MRGGCAGAQRCSPGVTGAACCAGVSSSAESPWGGGLPARGASQCLTGKLSNRLLEPGGCCQTSWWQLADAGFMCLLRIFNAKRLLQNNKDCDGDQSCCIGATDRAQEAELSRQSGATLPRGLPGDVQRCCAGRLLLHQNPCRSGNLHSRNTAVFSHVK